MSVVLHPLIGAVIGPLASGWLYETTGQAVPFIANSLVVAACAGVLWFGLQET